MKVTGITPILNVSDVAASIAWFERLGWSCGFTHGARENPPREEATFASVCSGHCSRCTQMFR
jgi:hypothetical protein